MSYGQSITKTGAKALTSERGKKSTKGKMKTSKTKTKMRKR